jgi:hypothetical protein
MHGDESVKTPVQLHLYLTTQETELSTKPHTTVKARGQSIGVGDVLATRINGGTWKCDTLTSASDAVNQATGGIGGTGTSDTVNTTIDFASPPTVTIGTTRAWHVHATVQSPGPSSGDTLSEVIDLYISQVDNQLLRETETLHLSISVKVKKKTERFSVNDTSATDFSGYGESLNITLPKACQAKADLAGLPYGQLDPRARLIASARAMERTLLSAVRMAYSRRG